MEFKNLAEVELLGEVPEGASVLAATADGNVVRVPGDGLGGGQFVINVKLIGDGEGNEYNGGASYIVYYSSSANNMTIDKSYMEIESAVKSGVVPVALVATEYGPNEVYYNLCALSSYYFSEDDIAGSGYSFSCSYASGNGAGSVNVNIYADGSFAGSNDSFDLYSIFNE